MSGSRERLLFLMLFLLEQSSFSYLILSCQAFGELCGDALHRREEVPPSALVMTSPLSKESLILVTRCMKVQVSQFPGR